MTTTEPATVQIAPEAIEVSPFQARRTFETESVSELALDIATKGQLQPIIVRPVAGKTHAGITHQLIAGERRWRAVQEAGLQFVRAEVRELDDLEAALAGLSENLQREDLTDLDQARAILSVMEELERRGEKISDLKMARRLSKSEGWVRNRTASRKYFRDVQEMMGRHTGVLTSAGEINTVRDEAERARLIALIDKENAPVERIKKEVATIRAREELQRATRRAPDEETQERLAEQARSGGGQMSRGRMVTGTPQSEARREVEAALAEIERQLLTLEAWAPKVERKYLQEKVEPRTSKMRAKLRRIGAGEGS